MCFGLYNAFSKPRISVITSVCNGDQFIEGFMADITSQTIFDQCELIMINAHSPGNEEKIIQKYMKYYPNIRYIKLSYDPGIYAVWNLAIRISKAEYITNANLDDRLKFRCYEKHAKALDQHPEIDLVYSDFLVTHIANETFEHNHHYQKRIMAEFSIKNMKEPLPNNHPMWRKSMHKKYGYFDEFYKHAGDYEMWLRAVHKGAKFLKVPGFYGLYYFNPKGLSTDKKKQATIYKEELKIYSMYKNLFFNLSDD
jgi:glycosyltransferase involved in cell wall biosynthesis